MRILVTAGPTQEPLDSVRFISNYSTGYLGYRIAQAAKQRGHAVTLITGPTHIKPPANIKIVRIQTAAQLERAVRKHFKSADCLIMTAAVADFRPKTRRFIKIKRKGALTVRLVSNPDILKSVSRKKGKRLLVGVALETDGLIKNARNKLKDKRLDLIVAVKLGQNILPFGSNRLSAAIITKDGTKSNLKNTKKDKLASILLDKIQERMLNSIKINK